MKLRLMLLFASVALGTLLTQQSAQATNFTPARKNPQRIVAVGDVHGDLDGLTQILQRAGLINSDSQWTGGDSTLILTGDLIDRGDYDRQVLDLLMNLEKQAGKQDGAVEITLGNHEVMNLTGDMRYVSKKSFLSFADQRSEKRREEALKDYTRYLKQRAKSGLQKQSEFTLQAQKKWLAAHPPGYLERREAFGPKGRYGRWLRNRSAIRQISGIVFVHGGLNEKLRINTKQLNGIIESELSAFDKFKAYFTQLRVILPYFDLSEFTSAVVSDVEYLKRRRELFRQLTGNEQLHFETCQKFLRFVNWMSFRPDGPLWFRGFADWTEAEGLRYMERLTKVFGAHHFVVGHTAQVPREIRSRFGGQVFLIDTGMLRDYFDGGGPSALEIQNGQFKAIYLDGEKVLLDTNVVAVAAK